MAQPRHHENPSQRFLQDCGSSDEKQCHDHDHEQEHSSSIGEKCATTHHDQQHQSSKPQKLNFASNLQHLQICSGKRTFSLFMENELRVHVQSADIQAALGTQPHDTGEVPHDNHEELLELLLRMLRKEAMREVAEVRNSFFNSHACAHAFDFNCDVDPYATVAQFKFVLIA
jgi:hypothetical protein